MPRRGHRHAGADIRDICLQCFGPSECSTEVFDVVWAARNRFRPVPRGLIRRDWSRTHDVSDFHDVNEMLALTQQAAQEGKEEHHHGNACTSAWHQAYLFVLKKDKISERTVAYLGRWVVVSKVAN